MYEMEQIDERVILVGIDTGNEDAANRSLDELSELAKTAKAAAEETAVEQEAAAQPEETVKTNSKKRARIREHISGKAN
jgi:GTP-binding protein HflX